MGRKGVGGQQERGVGERGGWTSIQTVWSSCGHAPGVVTRHLPCQGDIHGAIAAVSGHGSPTGALQRCLSLNCDITGSTRCPPEKQTNKKHCRDTIHG